MQVWLKWVLVFFFFSLIFFMGGMYFIIFKINIFFEFDLFMLNCSSVLMTLYFDWMTMFFISFVFYISCMVIFYSSDYMSGDLNENRFYLLVVMFVFSMFFLIVSPNLISILLGWDGLGLISYCLVIYYQNLKSYNAGMLTALMNRVGDVALLISISWMLNFGGWNFLFYLSELKNDMFMVIISFFIVLAGMTKSAQIPFSSWLPAAMAAPTPVSSLVHSSTLVTAGVYLMIRFSPCFSDILLNFLLFISLITMTISGMKAGHEYDLKKIIAFSTLSQLGLMISILSLGGVDLSFFHLLIHALFKALLFMGAGMVIHGFMGYQDIRFMGGLINSMPLTCMFMNISSFSLCGLPFLSGFYSKDLMMEFVEMSYVNILVFLVFFMSIGSTALYSFRLIYYLNLMSFKFISFNSLGDSSFKMLGGMFGLFILVVFMGSLMGWLIFDVPYFILLPFYMKFLTLIFVFIGILISLMISILGNNFKLVSNISSLKIFYFILDSPIVPTSLINYYFLLLGNKFYLVDQGWSEMLGSQKLKVSLSNFSKFLEFLSLNNIKIFIMMTIFFLIFMFLFI